MPMMVKGMMITIVMYNCCDGNSDGDADADAGEM